MKTILIFTLLAINIFITLIYKHAFLSDLLDKDDEYINSRTYLTLVLPITWSLFFYLLYTN